MSFRKIKQGGIRPKIEIDNRESDSVLIWGIEKTESNVVIVYRENLDEFIEFLKDCKKNPGK